MQFRTAGHRKSHEQSHKKGTHKRGNSKAAKISNLLGPIVLDKNKNSRDTDGTVCVQNIVSVISFYFEYLGNCTVLDTKYLKIQLCLRF